MTTALQAARERTLDYIRDELERQRIPVFSLDPEKLRHLLNEVEHAARVEAVTAYISGKPF